MQNKEFKKIENQGWKQMQQILDQELPVEKPKRRIVPWFWLSGVAAIFVAVAVFMNLDFAPSSVDSVVANDSNTSETIENIEVEIPELSTVSERDISIEKEILNKEVAPSPKEEIPNTEIINPIKFVPNKVANQPIEIVENKIDREVIPEYEAFESEKLAETSNSAPQTNISTTLENLKKLPIGSADLVYQTSKKLNLNTVSLKTIKPIKERKAKAQWAMNVGALSSIHPRIHGASIGAQVQFPVSKKWSLQTGLNYRIVNLQKVFVSRRGAQTSNALDDDFNLGFNLDSTRTSNISANELNESTYNTRTQNFEFTVADNYHFLAVPIEAHFQIKKPHRVWAGLETSYLLNRDGNSNTADLASAPTGFDPAFSYDSSSTPSVPRLDLGVSLGYQYQISNKLAANISYHHGNLFQQKQWHLDNRFFKLGANYKF